jgi:hypothetical protein
MSGHVARDDEFDTLLNMPVIINDLGKSFYCTCVVRAAWIPGTICSSVAYVVNLREELT